MPTVKGVTLSSSTPAFDNAGGVVRYIFEIIETKRANKFTSAICKAESHSDDIGPSVGGGESRISGFISPNYGDPADGRAVVLPTLSSTDAQRVDRHEGSVVRPLSTHQE